ncbi:hypothetical protein [Gemmobacter sp. 24YEA27]|uniref:hypothetical protein n=1 Tax=Gemmobacter sp. 24YEA27 TaxID=3040672 RepID=UPI0024B3B295|nr:hypothetical protein [Gemmobacter sp. 24YEA27]
MPKTCIKTKAPYVLAGSWSWRIITFNAEGHPYSILLAHRAERGDFLAMLVHAGKEATMLCRVEHHGSHPGWHVHYQAERPFLTGVTNFPRLRKRDCGGDTSFGPNMVSGFEAWAISVADRLFRFETHSGNLI